MANAVFMALSGPSDPSREEEYNDWYNNVHSQEMLRIPGVVSCRRYKLSDVQVAPPDALPYLAIYEVEPEALDTLPKEMSDRMAAGEMTFNEVLVPGLFAIWEPVSGPQS